MFIWASLAAAIIAAIIIYLITLDGSYRVKRSMSFKVSLDKVFNTVLDFKCWPNWSPWLMHEPSVELSYSKNPQSVDGYYEWQGDFVGAGSVRHVKIDTGIAINQEITLLRPFKVTNNINWYFGRTLDETIVSWEMVGHMPFYLRFLTKKIEASISRDYELGLAMLKGYLEPDSSQPRLEFLAAEELQGFHYWSIPFIGNLQHLKNSRPADLSTLETANADQPGLGLMIYHQKNLVTTQYNAEIAIAVSDSSTSSKYTKHSFNGGNYFKMMLHGSHQFLPLAWHALVSHCEMHKMKLDNKRPSLEIYHSDPADCTNPNDIVTALYIAIK